MERFRNKYRINSARAAFWDYSSNAAYFVTVNTKNKIPYFGTINNNKIELSSIGAIACKCWKAIPDHYPFVLSKEFVVMPDHIHGIIIINKNRKEQSVFSKNKFGPQSNNLGSIIRGFKIGVVKEAKEIDPSFKWHTRYYDKVIKNEIEYLAIVNYIFTNPHRWNNKKR